MKRIIIVVALLTLTNLLTGCMTLGQLDCSSGKIAKYDGKKWRCAVDETAVTGGAAQGIIWVNHHDMVVADWMSVTLDNNGTTLFVKPRNTGTFPKRQMLSIYVPTIPPGYNITGLRVCYGIVGDQADTEVDHLRLGQYQVGGSTSGSNWPGYLIRLEDTTVGNQAPNPPAGGFAFGDAAGFVCVNSSSDQWSPCLDQNNGTVNASIGFQVGDADDRIAIMAVGLHYDMSCTPN